MASLGKRFFLWSISPRSALAFAADRMNSPQWFSAITGLKHLAHATRSSKAPARDGVWLFLFTLFVFFFPPHVSICHLVITNISSQFKSDSPNLYPNCLRVNRILGETLGGLSLGPSSRASSFPCASAQKRASQEHPEIAAVTSNHWSPGVSTLVGNFLPFCHVLQGEGDTLQLDGNSVALNERLVLNRKLHLAKGSYGARWHQPS